ncbi:MAG: CCA tRNA nucleotidyltransferase [Syntrophobacterales bacterium]|nr:MAG: CCA tRNA nucleotidyltransferase [Syntrophobacterales bacterium]
MNIGDLLRRLPVLPVLRDAGICGEDMGFGAYAVGGLVRDLFLQRETLDVDVVIEGDGIAFASRFSADHGAHLTIYEKFKTANLVFPGGSKVDVATARTEVYEHPAALPLVKPGSIRDDLFRRDFSINTLATCLNPGRFGELFDPFQAREDIRKGTIRILHDRSFVDDPTRIFRAVRFEKRFDFKIEDSTETLIRDAVSAGLIERLSGYRIASELRLVLSEEDPVPIVVRLEELGVLASVSRRGKKHKEVKRLLGSIDEVKLVV